MAYEKLDRALARFEAAVLRKDELGAIPIFSDDPDEQETIDHTRTSIKREYTSARRALAKLMVPHD